MGDLHGGVRRARTSDLYDVNALYVVQHAQKRQMETVWVYDVSTKYGCWVTEINLFLTVDLSVCLGIPIPSCHDFTTDNAVDFAYNIDSRRHLARGALYTLNGCF